MEQLTVPKRRMLGNFRQEAERVNDQPCPPTFGPLRIPAIPASLESEGSGSLIPE